MMTAVVIMVGIIVAPTSTLEAQLQSARNADSTARGRPLLHIAPGALLVAGGEAEERARLVAPPHHFILRSGAQYLLSPGNGAGRAPWATLVTLAPEVRTVHNSALPFVMNEGALWAGRGHNRIVTLGARLQAGPLTVQVAPQWVHSENGRFQVIPFPQFTTQPARSVWANPFHPPTSSIDYPLRFGETPLVRTLPGQSRIALTWRGVSTGVSTENRWWGPSVRHPLLLGSNAEGFAHAFVETPNGLRTPIGRVQGQWLLGALRESSVFDDAPYNDRRALSGLLLALTPSADSALTLGVMRTVMSTVTSTTARGTPSLSHAFDVFTSVGQPMLAAPTGTNSTGTGRDQVTALFARYAFPEAGFDTWVEWARFAEPVTLSDFVEYPGHSQAYTFGVQWARRTRAGTVRLLAEATNTEPDASIRVRPVPVSYTSRTVPQGFTHRGRMLAGPLGPGASGQWFAADLFASRVRVGTFAGRIRWDNAVLWTPIVPQLKLEDISLLGGVRASLRVGSERFSSRLGVEYTSAVRLSYLFQSKLLDAASGTNGGVDIPNRTLAFTWSTTAFR